MKTIIAFSRFLETSVSFYDAKDKKRIFSFLDTKIKSVDEDPDKHWITTCSYYLIQTKYFLCRYTTGRTNALDL